MQSNRTFRILNSEGELVSEITASEHGGTYYLDIPPLVEGNYTITSSDPEGVDVLPANVQRLLREGLGPAHTEKLRPIPTNESENTDA